MDSSYPLCVISDAQGALVTLDLLILQRLGAASVATECLPTRFPSRLPIIACEGIWMLEAD
jgi:hypothetical protein